MVKTLVVPSCTRSSAKWTRTLTALWSWMNSFRLICISFLPLAIGYVALTHARRSVHLLLTYIFSFPWYPYLHVIFFCTIVDGLHQIGTRDQFAIPSARPGGARKSRRGSARGSPQEGDTSRSQRGRCLNHYDHNSVHFVIPTQE